MRDGVVIEELDEVRDEHVEAFARLLPQLSSSAAPLDAEAIARLASSPGSVVLLARVDGALVGALTLVVFEIPTGVRSLVEDVVVDGSARGRGVGLELVEAALAVARRRGARTVDLTSRPSREAANRLYLRAGFERRETNVYRKALEG